MSDFKIGLNRALLKTEIEYRAKHGENWEDKLVSGLDGSSPKALANSLRSVGFRIKEIVDRVDATGEAERWVVTTTGIIVFAWTPEDIRAGERRCQLAKLRGRQHR